MHSDDWFTKFPAVSYMYATTLGLQLFVSTNLVIHYFGGWVLALTEILLTS